MDEDSLDLDVVPLSKKHKRTDFSCGNVELDSYIRSQARQDSNKYCACPFVMIDRKSDSAAIIGYYTLSAATIILSDLPAEFIKKLARYPAVPATLLGRLAVTQQYQGRKMGSVLLMNALHRALESSRQVASTAVIVDAIDDTAVEFYKRFDFEPFLNNALRLYKPMIDISKQFDSSAIAP